MKDMSEIGRKKAEKLTGGSKKGNLKKSKKPFPLNFPLSLCLSWAL